MNKKAFIYIIIAGMLWGTSGLFVSALAPLGFSSLQMTAARAAVSFLCFFTYVLLFKREALKARLSQMLFFLAHGISIFGTAYCYFSAMQMTSVSTAVVLMYTAPIFVTVFSVIFLGERLTPLKTVAIALMLVGCCLVSGIIGGMKFDAVGILVGFLSGLCYSVYNIITKIEMRKGFDPISTSMYGFFFMTLIGCSVCKPWEIVSLSSSVWTVVLLIGMGVVTTVLPYFFYTLAMRDMPAGTASSLSIVEPLAATIFGIAFLSQVPDLLCALGIVIIFAAIVLLGMAENKKEKTAEKTGEKKK